MESHNMQRWGRRDTGLGGGSVESVCEHKTESRDIAAKPQEILVLFQGQLCFRSKTSPSLYYKAPKIWSTGSTQRWHL